MNPIAPMPIPMRLPKPIPRHGTRRRRRPREIPRAPQRAIIVPGKRRHRRLPGTLGCRAPKPKPNPARSIRVIRLHHLRRAGTRPCPNNTTTTKPTTARQPRLAIRLLKPSPPPAQINQRGSDDQHGGGTNGNPRYRTSTQTASTSPITSITTTPGSRVRGGRRAGQRGGRLGGEGLSRRELVGDVLGVGHLRGEGLGGVGVDDAYHVVVDAGVRGGAVEEKGLGVVDADFEGGGLFLGFELAPWCLRYPVWCEGGGNGVWIAP
jgi:hypothetical protein